MSFHGISHTTSSSGEAFRTELNRFMNEIKKIDSSQGLTSEQHAVVNKIFKNDSFVLMSKGSRDRLWEGMEIRTPVYIEVKEIDVKHLKKYAENAEDFTRRLVIIDAKGNSVGFIHQEFETKNIDLNVRMKPREGSEQGKEIGSHMKARQATAEELEGMSAMLEKARLNIETKPSRVKASESSHSSSVKTPSVKPKKNIIEKTQTEKKQKTAREKPKQAVSLDKAEKATSLAVQQRSELRKAGRKRKEEFMKEKTDTDKRKAANRDWIAKEKSR